MVTQQQRSSKVILCLVGMIESQLGGKGEALRSKGQVTVYEHDLGLDGDLEE